MSRKIPPDLFKYSIGAGAGSLDVILII